MKKIVLSVWMMMVCFSLFAQEETSKDSTAGPWKFDGTGTLNFTQTGFGNYWQGGGINSISLVGLANLNLNYKKGKNNWANSLDLAYGVVKQGKGEWQKNEDRIDFTSKYGRNLKDKLLLTTLLNFRTQFANGFDFSLPEQPLVSRGLAPAYINFSIGLDYQPNEDFSIYYSPINSKITIVTVDSLRESYMPAEFADQSLRYELGSYLNMKYRTKVVKNVTFQTKLDLFANYLENFGNIDINWETLIDFQVNKYISASLFTHLIYDDDIRFKIKDDDGNLVINPNTGEAKTGPRTQFKEVLGIGLTYRFEK